MPNKTMHLDTLTGLSTGQVALMREKHGNNTLHLRSTPQIIQITWGVIREPMFIMLLIACSLYFILGEPREGIMMLLAMILVTAISLYQEAKSANALKALQQFSQPKSKVIRNGREVIIDREEIVPEDIIILEEGMKIPADAIILQSNDFTVNESMITGESLPVDKSNTETNNILYQGATVNTGKCIAQVTATGNNTVLGKLGIEVSITQPPKTLLQLQINRFVRSLALFGLAGFVIILFMNYLHYGDWASSLLFALTLAMSAIPEEIPVAFSSFMALGAHKMSRLGIISRQPLVIENLGAVSVICLDKTGTITENKMQVKSIYDYETDGLIHLEESMHLPHSSVLKYSVLASEIEPFDAMEQAIWAAYHSYVNSNLPANLIMVYEYPLEGQPPMMTHVYENDSSHGHHKIVAAKGAAERIIAVCNLGESERNKIITYNDTLASQGYRVLGVASALHQGEALPKSQDDFDWRFEGLLALYDPPKQNIASIFKDFYAAHIHVKLITGDNAATALTIAGQTGIKNHRDCILGTRVMNMNQQELQQAVKHTDVFARMFPGAKLKVIEALKQNGEIVAMTGDGVNDGPALKSANIGIAMGKKGAEIARLAADLVLTDDNLDRMVTAVSEGRKIFINLKKAVRYIISIHIPIILVASIPLIFGWQYPTIFTPVHVIFLELIMGPTCSIFYEKEPAEGNTMRQKPRERNLGLFTKKELFISIVQGIIIAAATLTLYYYFMKSGASLEQTRMIVFTTLILSNVFLTFVNRSFTASIFYTSQYKNPLAPIILLISVSFLAALHAIPFIREIFLLSKITASQFMFCFIGAGIGVLWFEIYKMLKRKVSI